MNTTEPLSVTIREAQRLSGWSRWRVYDALKKRQITAKKEGRTTLVDFPSLKARIAALPAYEPGEPGEPKAA